MLAETLGVPIISLRELEEDGASLKSIRVLMASEARFSAATICFGPYRLIAHNPADPPGRGANSLAHELSHIILDHPPLPSIGAGGCRYWDQKQEEEADWLAGALLVPREGALQWLLRGGTLLVGALHFGVSRALFNWRANHTGVIRQLRRNRQAGRG